ncbi:MAG: gliding motility-associated protein GldE [Bacteroidia bacterium]|nr:gliding motility-associated protein GldE [Bacteroidia bacterium]
METEPGSIWGLHSFLLQDLNLLSISPDWPLVGQYLTLLLLLLISFMVSGSEVAFFINLNKTDHNELNRRSPGLSQRVVSLLENDRYKKLLATILITNNFVNVAAILVASSILKYYQGIYNWSEAVQFILEIGLITSLLLFFGEIIPKVFAARNRLRLITMLINPLTFLNRFLSPLSFLLTKGTKFMDERFKMPIRAASLDDLSKAIDITSEKSRKNGDNQDGDILKGIVKFSQISVKSIMKARVDVEAVEINMDFQEMVDFIQKYTYSRLPVYEESLDNVKGILHIKDLLPYLKEDSAPPSLKEVMREAYFVPENKKIDDLLDEFKSQSNHMAIVVDEFGGTAGIVTLEDVIEEIFGEINDEFDEKDWIHTEISPTEHIFEGRTPLNDIRKILGLDDKTFEDARGDSDSLGGLILELNGSFPKMGEVISYRNFEFKINAVTKNRITMVRLFIHPEEKENAS